MARESIEWFKEEMEKVLQANDHKGGWENCYTEYLTGRLAEEMLELLVAIHNTEPKEAVIKEAVDVANIVHMIADNARAWDH